MRVVAGVALAAEGFTVLRAQPAMPQSVAGIAMVAAGLCIIAGLWTPVVGLLVAALEAWSAFALPGDPWVHILLGTLGGALALLGPGAWSIDARLFGWKRIDIGERERSR